MDLAMKAFGILTIVALLFVGCKMIYELIKQRRTSSQLETELTLQNKDKKAVFQKYYARLCFAGILKSAVFGLTIGFACNAAAALVAWFVGYDNWMLLIAIGLGIALNAGCVAYFVRFRPTNAEIARRVDRLGMDERLVTMLELAGDESYIARRQREDAKRRVAEVSQKLLKVRLSKVMSTLAIITLVACLGTTSLVVFAAEDIIPGGDELIKGDDRENFVAITYIVEDGGEIIGETDQLITPGGDGTPVTAVALDGWMFVGWDDGLETPDREDLAVTLDKEVIALFEQIGDQEGEGQGDEKEPGEGGGGKEGDEAQDLPKESAGQKAEESQQPGQGDGQGDQDGDGEGKSDGNSGSGDQQGDGDGKGKGEGAGGRWEEYNQFLDGNTFYQDKIELYKEIAMEYITSGEEIPDEIREFIEKYYEGLI